ILHGLTFPGVSIITDFEGDARILAASSNINSFLTDPGSRFDTGVLLLARIGVVNFGNVLEDRVRGSGDDSELPPTHPSIIGVAAIAITSICAKDDSQSLISSLRSWVIWRLI